MENKTANFPIYRLWFEDDCPRTKIYYLVNVKDENILLKDPQTGEEIWFPIDSEQFFDSMEDLLSCLNKKKTPEKVAKKRKSTSQYKIQDGVIIDWFPDDLPY